MKSIQHHPGMKTRFFKYNNSKIRNFFYKINLTAEQGIEPRLLDPNSSVIPLDHSALIKNGPYGTRIHTLCRDKAMC